MKNHLRYCYGETNPVLSPAVAEDTLINESDLVSKTPVSAADFTWDTDLETTQEAFHDVFLGVSGQRSPSSDNGQNSPTKATDPVRVSTSGVFEFDCDSATFAQGDLVGPAKAAGDALESQKVVAVGGANLAIGRVEKAYPTATTSVKVRIFSTTMSGGPQDAA